MYALSNSEREAGGEFEKGNSFNYLFNSLPSQLSSIDSNLKIIDEERCITTRLTDCPFLLSEWSP
jgi:hypothetical protein